MSEPLKLDKHESEQQRQENQHQYHHYDITIEHKYDLSLLYDSYFDFTPINVKRIFLLFFPLNRLFKLVLIYCLFYHSIWWLPNSTSNNLAINYSNINAYVFFILVHYNFYDLFVCHLFIRLICFNLIKYFRLITNEIKLKYILNLIEFSIYLCINLVIFYYFKYVLEISIKSMSLIMFPHVFVYFHNNFDINLKLFNVILFNNQPVIKKLNRTEYVDFKLNDDLVSSNITSTSAKKIYTDCSNMSISTYLNQPLVMPNLLTKQQQSQNNLSADQANQTLKIIRQSLHRAKLAKSRMINFSIILFSFPRNLITSFNILINNLYHYTVQTCQNFILNFPRSNKLSVRKRNLFDYSYKTDLTNYIQHICQKNSISLREECNWFSFEFKYRLIQIFLSTFESIYYNFFLTRLFIPNDMNIREKEYYMYLVSSLISTFLSYWLYYIPFSLLKTLSYNAYHLGYWCRVERDEEKVSLSKWLNIKSYVYGDKVLYMGKSYTTTSDYCAAIPSNKFYSIYYFLFSNPIKTVKLLLCAEFIHLLMLLLIIYINRRWYAIALTILEVICNSHLFFIIMRDFLVLINENKLNLKKNKT